MVYRLIPKFSARLRFDTRLPRAGFWLCWAISTSRLLLNFFMPPLYFVSYLLSSITVSQYCVKCGLTNRLVSFILWLVQQYTF